MGGEGKWFNKYPNYDLKHKRKILQMEGREPCPAVPYTYIRNKKSYSTFSFPMQMYNKNTLQRIIR